jgi:hypothetical protein
VDRQSGDNKRQYDVYFPFNVFGLLLSQIWNLWIQSRPYFRAGRLYATDERRGGLAHICWQLPPGWPCSDATVETPSLADANGNVAFPLAPNIADTAQTEHTIDVSRAMCHFHVQPANPLHSCKYISGSYSSPQVVSCHRVHTQDGPNACSLKSPYSAPSTQATLRPSQRTVLPLDITAREAFRVPWAP